MGIPNKTLEEVLNETKPEHIWLSSDWHIYQNNYKYEDKKVNVKEISAYCKEHIKPDDVFLYLGDLCFRYANEEDKAKAQEFYKALPGIKVLILGNHDLMAGEEFYTGCGFDYIFEEFEYQNIIFSHRPVNMELYPEDYINIHGHIHKYGEYNRTDGAKNINVYPYFYNGHPVTLKYLLSHTEKLTKDNKWHNNVMLDELNVIYHPEADDAVFEYAIEAAKTDDALETVLNLEILSEFTINDFMRGGNYKDGAKTILELKRSEIPESEFGIPEERKYPLDTEAHVRSAIKLFNYVEPKYEKQLALKIKKKMKEYGIEDIHIGEKNRLSKYITEFCIETCDYLIRSLETRPKREFTMASMNPIKGIVNPCVMVASGPVIPTKQYIFSPSIISSKYLVIDENCKLKIVDRSYIENMQVDIYDFVGDAANVKKLYEAYSEQSTISNSYIYECLSGKQLLSEDQIEYDSAFRKINPNPHIDGFINNVSEFTTL